MLFKARRPIVLPARPQTDPPPADPYPSRGVRVVSVDHPVPAGAVRATAAYEFSLPPGAVDPRALVVVRAEAVCPAGLEGSARASHAPHDHPYAPPPARVARAAEHPGPPGRAHAGRMPAAFIPETPPPARHVREPERPGHPGGLVRLGKAPPEEPSPYPARVAAAPAQAPPGGEGLARSTAARPPADNLPPSQPARLPAARPWLPPAEGRARWAGPSGPPEPGPTPAARAGIPGHPLPAGRVRTLHAGYTHEPVGAWVPRVAIVREAEGAGFAGRVLARRAAPDALLVTPDPVFRSDGGAGTYTSRRGRAV